MVTNRDKTQRFDIKATFAAIIVETGLSSFLSPSPSMLILKTIIPKPETKIGARRGKQYVYTKPRN